MEQRLRLYRNHTPGCVHGYTKPVFQGDSAPDCSCPINAQGYLRNVVDESGKALRILHRSLGTRNQPVKDWNEARIIRDQWLEWGQTTAPNVNLEHSNVTVAQAAQFWFRFQETDMKSGSTRDKYEIFLKKRLLPWCQANGKHMMKDFDNAITVKTFYMSWRNLQPERGKGTVLSSDVPLSINTRLHELERYRTFLDFAKNNGWLKTNFAKAPYIKLKAQKVQWKFPFLDSEWERIKPVLDGWQDRYYKSNPGRKDRLRAYVYGLRWFGQRLSDTTMLGPHSISEDEDGKRFIELTQIKTGSAVKIPLPNDIHDMLTSLPILGETGTPVVLKRRGYTIVYGTQFWFWAGHVPAGTNIDDVVESAAKNWSDDVTAVLKKTIKQFGKFAHHSTPHTFRHTFACWMLNHGCDLVRVAAWLGDTPAVVMRHYAHANKDWHDKSHDDFMDVYPSPQRNVVLMEKSAKRKAKVVRMKRVV